MKVKYGDQSWEEMMFDFFEPTPPRKDHRARPWVQSGYDFVGHFDAADQDGDKKLQLAEICNMARGLAENGKWLY